MHSDNLPLHQDPVVTNIAARIDLYVARIHHEYQKDPSTFANDVTRREAAIMNIVRTVAASLDIGEHLVRKHNLGSPQSQSDVFDRIATAGLISIVLADSLKRMIFFRNTTLHESKDSQVIDWEYFILHQITYFSLFTDALLKK